MCASRNLLPNRILGVNGNIYGYGAEVVVVVIVVVHGGGVGSGDGGGGGGGGSGGGSGGTGWPPVAITLYMQGVPKARKAMPWPTLSQMVSPTNRLKTIEQRSLVHQQHAD